MTCLAVLIRSRIVVLVALLLASSMAAAGPVNCGTKPIRLAFYEYGYFYFEKDKRPAGIDHDIVDELQKRSGLIWRAGIWI